MADEKIEILPIPPHPVYIPPEVRSMDEMPMPMEQLTLEEARRRFGPNPPPSADEPTPAKPAA